VKFSKPHNGKKTKGSDAFLYIFSCTVPEFPVCLNIDLSANLFAAQCVIYVPLCFCCKSMLMQQSLLLIAT